MFKANPSDRFYEFEELQREVRALYPDSDFDESTLRLGLYLAPDLNVLQSRQMNHPNDTELIVDPYVDETLWELLTNVHPTVKLRILTQQMKKDFRLEARKFAAQHGNTIEIKTTSKYHDRFIVEDKQRCWHIGASIKDAGSKACAFSELLQAELVAFVISNVESEWVAASPVVL
jgi:hypothetical protein